MADRTPGTELRRQRRRDDTVQGLFVAGADGAAYGWRNDADPREVREFLDEALARFRRRPPRRAALSEPLLHTAFARTPDPSTSVVRVFTRIRPVPRGVDPLNQSVGRDHLWILASEVKEMLAARQDGGRFPLPRTLAARLARFHLVDNVRGEPDLWSAAEVKRAAFFARRVGPKGSDARFVFEGAYAQRTADGKRGLEGTIRGALAIDPQTSRIVRFRAYGAGQAWGRSLYTPRPPRGRFPLVFALVEADDSMARAVPPQAVSSGEAYPHLHIRPRDYLRPTP